MNRKLILSLCTLLALAISLAACASATPTPAPQAQPTAGNAPASGAGSTEANSNPSAGSDQALARTDAQGAVEFTVTPLNLTTPGATLDFDVSMNTHSVDVSWDLAAQSRLKTDTGLEVKGLSWPVGGGHHYEGQLTFPAKIADGQALLEGAKTLTLIIRNTDVAERMFVWELSR